MVVPMKPSNSRGRAVSPMSGSLVWWGLGDLSQDLGTFWERLYQSQTLLMIMIFEFDCVSH